MRKIKFRAWDGKNMLSMADDDFWLERNVVVAPDDGPRGAYYERDWPIMQYTGLEDFEGREIYEGDLYKDAFGNVAHVVFTTHTAPTVFGAGFAGEMLSDGSRAPLCSGVKVIGNIYESPELLEGKQ